jgi:hypothetical protein
MKRDLMSGTAIPNADLPDGPKPTITPPIEQIPLPHVPRELTRIVEPGQIIPNRDRLYHLICSGELQMIQFIRGRWDCPRPELPNLACALGLRLQQPDARPASRCSAA